MNEKFKIMKKLLSLITCLSLLLLSSCSLSEEEKQDKGAVISENLREVIDSVFIVHNIEPNNISHWLTRNTLLKSSTKHNDTYELKFEFDIQPSTNPRETYSFEGVVYADEASLEIAKNSDGQYFIEMNALFYGDDRKKYVVDDLCFPEFSDSKSVCSEFVPSLNVPVSAYFDSQHKERERFKRGLSDNEKGLFISNILKNNSSDCSYAFNGNWLEIKMDNDMYPIEGGNPDKVCQLFFEAHANELRYCYGVRLFTQRKNKIGAYRNPSFKE